MISWDQVGAWFASDSMKVDVFVSPATATMWKKILDVVTSPPYAAELLLNGQPARIWPPVAELFDAVSLLVVRSGGLVFETAFFSPLEIEFWFDGRKMMSASEFECLVLFLKDIANAAGVDVVVTPENTHDRPFLVFRQQTGQLEFAPSWKRLNRGTP